MELVNALYIVDIHFSEVNEQERAIIKNAIEVMIQLLNPIAPHFCEELWHEIGHRKSLYLEPWPQYNEKLLQKENMLIIVQVNGKLRDKISVPSNMTEEKIKEKVLALPRTKKWINTKKIDKIIYVNAKLVKVRPFKWKNIT